MVHRVPPPIIYQNQDAARAGLRKDYADRVRMTDDGLYILGRLVRIVTWPIRALIGLLRPIG